MPLRDPPADLSGFPAWTLGADRPLARIHRLERDARFFSASGGGRFDLGAPRGTLYAAATPVGAFIEVFRRSPFVPQAEVDARWLATLRVADDRRLADCASSRARRHGVTAAIHSTPDYALCQRWAEAFAKEGFEGIRYLVSHDPSAREVGIALFGKAGIDSSLILHQDQPIPDQLIDEARARFGVVVLPTPA